MLEVIALTPDDARAASDGGADRLELVGTMADDGLSPSPSVVERVCAASSVPVRVMVRLTAGFAVGDDLGRLVALARSFASAGAAGLVFGFLDDSGRLDLPSLRALADATDLPWTLHRSVDHLVEPGSFWAEVGVFPGLDQVLTAGSPLGVADGLLRLVGWAHAEPGASGRLMAGGGLQPAHVPVLREAGLRAFHIGSAVRPGRSFAAPVDAGLVAEWARLVADDWRPREDSNFRHMV